MDVRRVGTGWTVPSVLSGVVLRVWGRGVPPSTLPPPVPSGRDVFGEQVPTGRDALT